MDVRQAHASVPADRERILREVLETGIGFAALDQLQAVGMVTGARLCMDLEWILGKIDFLGLQLRQKITILCERSVLVDIKNTLDHYLAQSWTRDTYHSKQAIDRLFNFSHRHTKGFGPSPKRHARANLDSPHLPH